MASLSLRVRGCWDSGRGRELIPFEWAGRGRERGWIEDGKVKCIGRWGVGSRFTVRVGSPSGSRRFVSSAPQRMCRGGPPRPGPCVLAPPRAQAARATWGWEQGQSVGGTVQLWLRGEAAEPEPGIFPRCRGTFLLASPRTADLNPVPYETLFVLKT